MINNKTKKIYHKNLAVIIFNRIQNNLNQTYKILGIDIVSSTVKQIHYAFTHMTKRQKTIIKKIWGNISPGNPANAFIYKDVIHRSVKTAKEVAVREIPGISQYYQAKSLAKQIYKEMRSQKGGGPEEISGKIDAISGKIEEGIGKIDNGNVKMEKQIEEISKTIDKSKNMADVEKSLEKVADTGIMRDFISKFVKLSTTEVTNFVKKFATKGILIVQNMIEVIPVIGEGFAFAMVILNSITAGLDTAQLGLNMYGVVNKKFNPLFKLFTKIVNKIIQISKKMKKLKNTKIKSSTFKKPIIKQLGGKTKKVFK